MTELRVLSCDNHLLVVDKPAGIPTVPDASGDESLLDLARHWVRERFAKPGNVFLGVVQRLNRPVSGVLVFARTSKAAARLTREQKEGRMRKVYWGVGQGRPPAPGGVLEQWLEKDEARNRVRALAGPGQGASRVGGGAKRAVTRWRVLEEREGRTLYELAPETGRPHQLRVCSATLGTPLAGDLKYGAREALPDRSIALHARILELEHPSRGERLSFVAPAPRLPVWSFAACRE